MKSVKWSSSEATYPRGLNHYCEGKRAILMTGDGTLKDDDDFDGLYNWYKSARMSRIAVLQVMHHGSKDNTKPGRASQIDPLISVFSSDPYRKRPGHPDTEVIKDFMSHNPLQADQHTGVSILTYLSRP